MIVQSHTYDQGIFTPLVTSKSHLPRKQVSMRIVPSKDQSSELSQAFINAAVAVLKAAQKRTSVK